MHDVPDHENEVLFWQFFAGRQEAWYNRMILGQLPPWSDDQGIARLRLANIYRELDRTTQYLVCEVLENTNLTDGPALIAEIMAFRYMNSIGAHIELSGPIRAFIDDPVHLSDVMPEIFQMRIDRGERVASTATATEVTMTIGKFIGLAPKLWDLMQTSRGTLENVAYGMATIDGISEHQAYHMAVDMCYPTIKRGGYRLGRWMSEDTWVAMSNATNKGFKLLGVVGGTAAKMKTMRAMRDNSAERIRYNYGRWMAPKRWDGQEFPVTIANIERALSEFGRYITFLERGTSTRGQYKQNVQPEWVAPCDTLPIYGPYPRQNRGYALA